VRYGHRSSGIMDVNGKNIVPDRYKYITWFDTGKFICATDTASWIFDVKTGKYTALPKPYVIGSVHKIYNSLYYLLATANRKCETLDSNFKIVPAAQGIQYYRFDTTFKRWMAQYEDGRKKIIDSSFREYPVTIAGEPTAWVQGILQPGEGIILYQLPDGRNIVQFDNGRWFKTNYTSLQWDAHARWFMAYSNEKNLLAIVDSNGKELMPPLIRYSASYSPSQNWITLATVDEKSYIITREGRLAFDGKYDFASPLFQYYIVGKNGYRGLIDKNGKEILPLNYPYMEFENGQLRFGRNYLEYETWGMSRFQ
jgi:hypothetical protein